MSESADHEEVVVTADGVRVIKRFEDEEFPVPAIVFEFTSGREEEVTVELSDTVPDSIEVEDLGFHPEYGSDYWTIEEGKITFERAIESEGTYTTVYGIRATGSDDIAQFLSEPRIEHVDPPLPDDAADVVIGSDDAIVEDAIATESEIPETVEANEDDGSEAGETIEALDLEDRLAAEEESPPAGAVGDVPETGDGVEAPDDGLVAALAGELRRNAVADEDVATLREALLVEETDSEGAETAVDSPDVDGTTITLDDEALDESGSTVALVDQLRRDVESLRAGRARLDRLQRDVAELRAYTGALEEFLDEQGTAEELIADFESRLEDFERRLTAFEEEVDETVQTTVDETLADAVEDSIDAAVESALEEAVEQSVEAVAEPAVEETVATALEEAETALEQQIAEASLEEFNAGEETDESEGVTDDIDGELDLSVEDDAATDGAPDDPTEENTEEQVALEGPEE